MNRLVGAACAIALGFAAASTSADVMVGGSAMFPQKNIVQNAVNSKDHTTLVAAVKAADLVETLESKGPFTVFAPVNAAFDALPAGTVETLLKPENKATLTKVLTYHVVPGRFTSTELERLIRKSGGTATLKTASGGSLWLMKNGERNITVKDETGAVADISIYDVLQSNGVIYSIDRVLMPK
ncbi:MAG: fasciclin domain-containing protein [Gammaproteobacteria bacterium]